MAIHKIDGVDGVDNYPKKFITLWCSLTASASIAKGDVVILDTGTTSPEGEALYVKQSDAADSVLVVGVAAETVTNGAGATRDHPIRVQVAGYNSDTVGSAAISLGGQVGSAASGQIVDAATSDIGKRPLGLCINAIGSGLSDGAILIYDHGMFG